MGLLSSPLGLRGVPWNDITVTAREGSPAGDEDIPGETHGHSADAFRLFIVQPRDRVGDGSRMPSDAGDRAARGSDAVGGYGELRNSGTEDAAIDWGHVPSADYNLFG